MDILSQANRLSDQIQDHYSTASSLAAIINDKLPEDKQLHVPAMDKSKSVKENASKLVQFIQKIQDFVDDLDNSLKENLTPEQYAKVAKVTATVEQILPIVQTITKGIVSVVGPIVSTIAKKLKNSQVLQNLKKKLDIVHSSAVIEAINDSHATKGCLDKRHPGIKENKHQLDEHIKSMEPELDNDLDFSTIAKALVAWHRRANKK